MTFEELRRRLESPEDRARSEVVTRQWQDEARRRLAEMEQDS